MPLAHQEEDPDTSTKKSEWVPEPISVSWQAWIQIKGWAEDHDKDHLWQVGHNLHWFFPRMRMPSKVPDTNSCQDRNQGTRPHSPPS